MKDLIATLEKEKVINLNEASKILGNHMAVYRLAKKGDILAVQPEGLGFFTLPDFEDGEIHFSILKKYYPKCVVSGRTALALHNLSLDYIDKIDVDIPNTTNLSNSLFEVHRVSEKKISHVIEKSFPSQGIPFEIKIYSPERSLFEAYKYFKGSEPYYKAIKEFYNQYLLKTAPGDQFDIILKIHKEIGKEIIEHLNLIGESDG